MSGSLCECRAEGNKPHKGRTRLIPIDINAQPSGHGSYTVRTQIRVCAAHSHWFLTGHLNVWRPK